jgi:hypothetical protein
MFVIDGVLTPLTIVNYTPIEMGCFSPKQKSEFWACPPARRPSLEIYPGPWLSFFKPCHSLSARLAAYYSALVPVVSASQTLYHPLIHWRVQQHTCQTRFIHRLKPVVLWKSYKNATIPTSALYISPPLNLKTILSSSVVSQ